MSKASFLVFSCLWAALALSFGVHGFTSTPIARQKLSFRASVADNAETSKAADATTDSLSLFSPCKINLFLRIIRKREDGFHDLASLFQAVGFGDTLELTNLDEGEADEFSCNMEGVPVDSTNLVLRALQLMREKTGVQQYFQANLIKQVPAQAGLGGGSANAATAMWGANQLMGNPATLEQMVEWSGDLGSDITFFLSRGTAYCTGRGEIMDSIDPPLTPGTKLCIVKPNVGLSTPAVFKALEYDKLSTLDAKETLLPAFLKGVDTVPDEYFINDLEPPAFSCVPELAALKDELCQVEGFQHIMMSGSGTSIFCLGSPADEAAFLAKFDERDDVQVFFTEFIDRPEGVWFERPN
ncbi:erythritol kinase, chloroplastic/chromoplastic [Seminavis robusta]|uniref:4-(cytidine 5'-diphospho)-2-C-methyl-D-erythritol kinase n=1 Tax=Seminavis robusta TaxID=568900 RepID=A0A9N8HQ83_9STRA|nr:erythritol kinase, chloroplastic/chromoplastic [Seminavis robusta]|eukprot:Sro1261_g257020.1 erythritol kinase, chloroplastic/chromoplastic (355) ;mRNA; r:11883-13038